MVNITSATITITIITTMGTMATWSATVSATTTDTIAITTTDTIATTITPTTTTTAKTTATVIVTTTNTTTTRTSTTTAPRHTSCRRATTTTMTRRTCRASSTSAHTTSVRSRAIMVLAVARRREGGTTRRGQATGSPCRGSDEDGRRGRRAMVEGASRVHWRRLMCLSGTLLP
ncbi:uncharacterized protein C8Q71DRAFT_489740 [Rhodofomes roseus]|uniref:Uncharacterized protein n=1 Tax=Rhodofomes roseus TaxID=34475 RepID=A0ABQ8KLQ4_9APHY|nr:uncharacterized protein C8Q71DRAFT_489740 [Rhodofomes roseus]KAH9839005.1 hypothetical protein C8Q71DRAFT_489740 [Rhodofomes roseus]